MYFQALKQHCAEFVLQNISPENVLGVEKMAEAYDQFKLTEGSAAFVSRNKEAIFYQAEFNECDKAQVQSLLFANENRVRVCLQLIKQMVLSLCYGNMLKFIIKCL